MTRATVAAAVAMVAVVALAVSTSDAQLCVSELSPASELLNVLEGD